VFRWRWAWLGAWLFIALRGKPGDQLVEHLMGGVLALAQRGQQVGGGGHAILIGNAAKILIGDLTQWNLESLGLALKQLAPISTARRR